MGGGSPRGHQEHEARDQVGEQQHTEQGAEDRTPGGRRDRTEERGHRQLQHADPHRAESAAPAASRHGTVTRGNRAVIQSSTTQLAATPTSRLATVSRIRAPPPAIPVTRTAPSAIPIAMMLPANEQHQGEREAHQRHEVEQDPAHRGRPERRQAPLRRHGLPQVGHPPDARPHRAQQPDPGHRVALRHGRGDDRQHGVGRGRGHGLGDGLLQVDEPRRVQRE